MDVIASLTDYHSVSHCLADLWTQVKSPAVLTPRTFNVTYTHENFSPEKMWKSVVGHDVSVSVETQGDDWDTDPDFVNDISEKEQRWGAKTIEGSGRKEHINIHQLRSKVSEEHDVLKKKEMESGPKASHGYGGRFGVERDRMDKSAVGHEYVAEVEKHSSQTDAAKGFGGKFGVERDRADKSAVGFDYKGEVEKHTSQKDYSRGFGGRYGVETDKRDKAALGYDYKGETEKHESQRDYAKGFGGQYGIQKDRVDKSAVGFNEMEAPTTAYKKTTPVEATSSGARGLKAKFESMAEEKRKQEEEEKAQQVARQQQERKAVVKMRQEAQQPVAPAEEPAAPAPLPKKISSEAWPPAQSHPAPEPEPVRTSREHPVPSLPMRQSPPEDYEEPPALPPRTPEGFQVVEEPIYEAEPEPENDYEDVGEMDKQEQDNDPEGDYEDVLEPEDPCVPSTLAGPSGSPAGAGAMGISAVALYDYQGEGSDELSFDPDDIITDIEMVDEGWWRGRCHGHFGLFPANYVKLLQ
ncbi:hematopoietic lineage cell-specific protein [Marmota monax]|uniref:Hematopoietic lineage cell-specific protein n=2 Tax=Marmota monax TaxID=9995 RepID=A0A834QCZ6_MARMO|nr:hematopoietic lineage cell-specific protein [Marmota monax]